MADYWKEVNQPPASKGPTDEEFLVPTNAKLVRQMKTASAWLWAFAGFTLLNLVLAEISAPIGMVVALITAEYVVAVGKAVGSFATPLGFVVAGILIAFTAALAFCAQRFAVWAFWAGIVVVAVDAVVNYFVTTLAGVWPFIIHFVAIWFLVLGLKAAKLHRDRRAAGKA